MNPQRPVLPGHEQIPEKVFAEDQPQYNQLPALIVPGPDGEVISRWEMTTEEYELFHNNGYIYLSLLTFGQPLQPIVLRVATPEMILAEERRTYSEAVVPVPQQPPEEPETALVPTAKTDDALAKSGLSLVQDIARPEVKFSRYKEDNTLQLFPIGSITSARPAPYSLEHVIVKAEVITARAKFMVCLPTTRTFLDAPGAEDALYQQALTWI